MINNYLDEFLLRNDPESRHFRSRLTRSVFIGFYTVLGIWLIADIVFTFVLSDRSTSAMAIDLAIIFILAASGALSYRTMNQGNVDRAAMILSALILILTLICTLLFPQQIYILSVAYLVGILLAGITQGGKSAFIFAGLSFAAISIAWWRVYLMYGELDPLFDGPIGVFFIIGQATLYFGFAGILQSLADYIRETVERLSAQTEQLTQMALTDPLTGLSNRRHILDQMEREFTRARRYRRPLSLVFIDMDGFKPINDHFGHIFGDDILRGAAVSLSGVLRSTDLLARIGGDEFAILLPETTIGGAQGVVTKLRKALSAYSRHLGASIPELTFCAGISQLRQDDKSSEALLARADDAQCRAKDAGKGQTRTQLELDQLPLFNSTRRNPRRN
ncbi:MAG: GGDEF domain-containing protein [Anaerolineales bacterium]